LQESKRNRLRTLTCQVPSAKTDQERKEQFKRRLRGRREKSLSQVKQ